MEEIKPIPIYKQKDYIKEYNKLYYLKNRDKICEMINSKVVCTVCGREMAKSNLYNHMKTTKCMKKRKLQINEDKVQELENRIKELEEKIKTNNI